MPGDQSSKPPPNRDKRLPGGFPLPGAVARFCDPELWRKYDEARAADPRRGGRSAVVSAGPFAEQDTVHRAARNRAAINEHRRCWDILRADFWRRVQAGEIIGVGHLDTPHQPAQRIPPGEWQHLNKNKSGKDGSTFEGVGCVWYRVRFHLAADLPDDDTAPAASSGDVDWTGGLTQRELATLVAADDYQEAQDNWGILAVPSDPEDDARSERYFAAEKSVRRRIRAFMAREGIVVGGWDESIKPFGGWSRVPEHVLAEAFDSIGFGATAGPHLHHKGRQIEIRFFRVGDLPDRDASAPAQPVAPGARAPATAEMVDLPQKVGPKPDKIECCKDRMRDLVEADKIDFMDRQARASERLEEPCDASPDTARKAARPFFVAARNLKSRVKAGEIDPAEVGPATVVDLRIDLARFFDDPEKAGFSERTVRTMLEQIAKKRAAGRL